MVKPINYKISHNVLYGVFIFLLLLEVVVQVFDYSDYNFRIKAISKGLLIITVFTFSFFYSYRKDILIKAFLLIIIFFIGQFFLTNKHLVFNQSLWFEITKGDIYILFKYTFILFFVAFFERIPNCQDLIERLIRLFYFFMIVNTVFIIMGPLLNFEFLKSYPFSERFGFQGLIQLVGESVHLYIIIISLQYLVSLKTKKYGLFFFFLLGGIMLGKKAMLLYVFLLFIVHLVHHRRYFVLSIIGGVSVLSIIFYDFMIDVFLEIFPFWSDLYKSEGIITVIFSTRDILFQQSIEYIQTNWSLLNYFFGGVDFLNFRSEFGFFDLFLTLGVLGTIVYLWFIYEILFKKQRAITISLISIILIIEFVSGGLFINVLPMLFLYLMAKYLKSLYKEV